MSTIEDVLISKTSSTDTSGAVDVSFLFRPLDIVDEDEVPTKPQRLFNVRTHTSMRDSCSGCSGVLSGAWLHDPVHAWTLWSVHPVCNSLEFPGYLWRRLHSFLHFLSPANILLARYKSSSGGLVVNSRTVVIMGCRHSGVLRARALGLFPKLPVRRLCRRAFQYGLLIVSSTGLNFLYFPIPSIPYQFSCALSYTHTGTTL